MAVRRALAAGLASCGRAVREEAIAACEGGWTTGPKVRTFTSHSPAHGASAGAWQQRAAGLSPAASAAARAQASGAGAGSCCELAAAAGLRPFSSSAKESLQGAAQRIQMAASSSVEAVRAAGSAVARAPGAVYSALPASAQRLLSASQSPNGFHRVLSLQLTAFWQRYGNALLAGGAAAAGYGLWRALCRVAAAVADPSDASTAAALLALSAAAVAGAYATVRRRYTIDPGHAYRLAMYRLNTHPGLLEVMGAPLVGSPVQASVLTGGSLAFRGLRPRVHSKRIQMIFPLKGSERRGLVSLEAKKRHGHLHFKLLAVDVPSVAGGEQRIFLEGGPALYDRGGVLHVLRDPFVRALSMEEVFAAEDEAEAAEEQRAAARAAARPKPLDQGRGMFLHERLALGARRAWAKLTQGGQGGGKLQQVGAPAPSPAGEQPAAKKAA